MRRTAPLIGATLMAACSRTPLPGRQPSPITAAVTPRTQSVNQQAVHVLSRLTFGARPGDLDLVREMGLDRWIDEQLQPTGIDDSKAEQWLGQFEVVRKSASELEAEYQNPGLLMNQLAARRGGSLSAEDSVRLRQARQNLRRIADETQAARVARALLAERQLQELMTDFWLNHFSVFAGKGIRQQYYLADYENRVIRPRSLGRFRDLLGAVAKSPAMLFYLDNWESAADSGRPRPTGAALRPARRAGLNENYGRELLELHTLGVDGGYTQQDVINAARALTGWTIAGPRQGGGFTFAPFMHDAGEKVILGRAFRPGRGIEDGEDLLDLTARHPSTARFISLKLARRFVSDTPSWALVERAAAVFTRTDGDIREVVRTIVTSPEFFAREAYRAKVKSPFEVVLSALRALNAEPDHTPRTARLIAGLGQPIFGRQTPDGWPEAADGWMGTGAILNRINFGLLLASGRVPGANPMAFPGVAMLREAPREEQVNAVVNAFLGGDVSAVTRSVLLTGRNPTLSAKGSETPVRGLAQVLGLALGSSEFQRR